VGNCLRLKISVIRLLEMQPLAAAQRIISNVVHFACDMYRSDVSNAIGCWAARTQSALCSVRCIILSIPLIRPTASVPFKSGSGLLKPTVLQVHDAFEGNVPIPARRLAMAAIRCHSSLFFLLDTEIHSSPTFLPRPCKSE
jgi:hypothetical protein